MPAAVYVEEALAKYVTVPVLLLSHSMITNTSCRIDVLGVGRLVESVRVILRDSLCGAFQGWVASRGGVRLA